MHRLALLLALPAPLAAQGGVSLTPVPGPVRDAGVFHVSTGTWSRAPQQAASLGPDVIYSNTAATGYFASVGHSSAAQDFPFIDDGRVPAAGGLITGADRTVYRVSGLQFSYCTDVPSPNLGITFDLWDSYAPCDSAYVSPAFPTHLAGSISVTGLPGGSPAVVACWTVTLDVSGGGEFCLEGDGGPLAPGFDNDPNLDSMGIAWIFEGAAGSSTGPLLAGNPDWSTSVPGAVFWGGGGTYYHPSDTCPTTGLDNQDFFRIEEPGPFYGCRFFGGYKNTNGCGGGTQTPLAAFHTVLYAELEECETKGVRYCEPAEPNGSGVPAQIHGSTIPDGSGLHLDVSGGLPNQFAYLVASITPVEPGVPVSYGRLCLGGTIVRYSPVAGGVFNSIGSFNPAGDLVNLAGTSSTGLGFDVPAMAPPPASSPLAGQTWNFQAWYRDHQPAGAGSNFSSALRVTF